MHQDKVVRDKDRKLHIDVFIYLVIILLIFIYFYYTNIQPILERKTKTEQKLPLKKEVAQEVFKNGFGDQRTTNTD